MASRADSIERKRDKSSANDPVMGCRPVYQRRRASSCRRASRSEGTRDHSSDVTPHALDSVSSANKSRRRLRKLIGKLMRENYMLTRQLEEINTDPEIIAKFKETDQLITKLRQEYRKLPKHEYKIYDEHERLNILLEQREKEYHQLCSQYEKLFNSLEDCKESQSALAAQNKKLEAENAQAAEDIGLLKNVVYRLNAELERYQDKLRTQVDKNSGAADGSKGLDATPSTTNINRKEEFFSRSWGSVNLHALGPLLNAYQENLCEKSELLIEYEQELANFGGRCKEIILENDHMHEELEELRAKCDRYADEIKALTKNNTTLKKENAVLSNEALNHKKHIEELQGSYEKQIESLAVNNESLKKERAASANELASLKDQREVLSRELDNLRKKSEKSVPVIVHTAAVEECKSLLNELKEKYDVEKEKLMGNIKRLEDGRVNNERELISITAERNHLKTLSRTLERNLKRAQRTSEHARSVMRATQVSCESFRQQLNQTTAYCEELFAEYERVVGERAKLVTLLHETEKENASIDRLGKNITDRVNKLKNQLQIVQRGAKQQVATVEKRMKSQESRVHRMKREYRSKVRRLRNLIKQKEDMIGKLQKEKVSGSGLESSRHVALTTDRNLSVDSKSRRATRVSFVSKPGAIQEPPVA